MPIGSLIPKVLLGMTSGRTLLGEFWEGLDSSEWVSLRVGTLWEISLKGSIPWEPGPIPGISLASEPFFGVSLDVWAPLGPLPTQGSYLIALERWSHQDDGPHGRHHVIGGHMFCLERKGGG